MQDNLSFENKNILIVDDNRTNVLLIRSMLDDAGYLSIYTAESAATAYEILERNDIDIILLDVVMPEISGIEACQTIRKTQKHRNTPIIMITADDSNETLKNCFDAGANDFVAKPINLINLSSRIKNVLLLREKDTVIQNQTSSAAVSEIMEVISNQWKTPLSEINKIALKTLETYKNKDLDNYNLEKSMTMIDNLTQELSKAIDDIKDISKVDDKASLVDMNKIVRYALNVIKKSYKSKNISLQIKEAKDLEKILMFPNEFVRVLLNIFINSQEAFIRQRSNSKPIVQIITSQDKKYTSVTIRDNAGGISEENISKIFDPYFSTKIKKNTTGLGLYSCKQTIEQHQGGKLTISSKNGLTEVRIQLLNHSPYIDNHNK